MVSASRLFLSPMVFTWSRIGDKVKADYQNHRSLCRLTTAGL